MAADGPMDLAGSTVLVTGASSGIGRETAVLLSFLNARLILTGRNRDRLEETRSRLSGQGHRVAPFDLACTDRIPQWLGSLAAETGPLGGLVHAAGVQSVSPIRFARQAGVEQLLRANLESAIMLVQASV
jgi:NAD(P)-dependent dehydrogenase (short-subunit alcohol dehydrogenase family)